MSMPRETLQPQPPPPEKKGGNTCLILGLIFGGIGGFVVLCGGCCIGGMYFGLNEIEEQARRELAANNVIAEHVGEIESCELDFMATAQHASGGADDTFVFKIAGTKGAGTVVAELVDDGAGSLQIASGELTLDSGETYQLVDDAAPDDQGAEFAAEVRQAVAANPVLNERIGEIESFSYDRDASAREPGEDVFVFQIAGVNGRGTLRAECVTVDANTESVTSAELVLENGEKVQLFPDKPLN